MPTPLTQPRLLHGNADVAELLGLDAKDLYSANTVEILAGNRPLPGGAPLASVYAGHQFGSFVPQLGDGRAILLAQVRGADQGLWDLQLKGAGPTPYSRFADGRAVIRSSVREYLAGEAMHGLGIPTTRALSLIIADDPVRRETIERAAVVCRVAPTHLRFGHFEVFYYRNQHQYLAPLADYIIAQHFPEFSAAPDRPTDRYRRWLREVCIRTGTLIAQWQSVGFCHGVMNSDNMSIIGLTLDYGPYGFIDGFDAHHICNHSDEGGRYAWDQQPQIGHWNCSRLLQATLPLLADDPEQAVPIAEALLDDYAEAYRDRVTAIWRSKLGLRDKQDIDPELINRYLSLLHAGRCDFTRSFRLLASVTTDSAGPLRDEMRDLERFDAWLLDYRARLRNESSNDAERAAWMNTVNPKYVLRNHLAQAAIAEAEAGSGAEIERLMQLLRRPHDEQPDFDAYAAEPPPEAQQISVSCSS